MAGADPLRVLVVHQGILRGRDEALEVRELALGLIAAARTDTHEVVVDVSNARRMLVDDGGGTEVRWAAGDEVRVFRGPRYDVAHLHLAIVVRHLWLALLLRLRGTRIVCSPMSMLGDDFARAAWFRRARPGWGRMKSLVVALLRWGWLLVAHVFVVASEEERRQARLPERRCVQVPLVTPDSPLAEAALSFEDDAAAHDDATTGPVAFTSRLDVYRKGFDRLVAWLDDQRDHLPRPAVLLLAPAEGEPVPGLEALVDEGLVEWDTTSRGAQVAERLRSCRAQMLLSRWDGQPRVLREAAVMGVPTISTVASHFTEVVDLLGAGVIVDGDDPTSVQAAFEAVAQQPRPVARGRAVFDRDRVGRYLLLVLRAAAERRLPEPTSYYAFEPETLP